MTDYLIDACENIDASIFSGDVLFDPEKLAKLKQYIARWSKEISEHEEAVKEQG